MTVQGKRSCQSLSVAGPITARKNHKLPKPSNQSQTNIQHYTWASKNLDILRDLRLYQPSVVT